MPHKNGQDGRQQKHISPEITAESPSLLLHPQNAFGRGKDAEDLTEDEEVGNKDTHQHAAGDDPPFGALGIGDVTDHQLVGTGFSAADDLAELLGAELGIGGKFVRKFHGFSELNGNGHLFISKV